MSLLKRFFFHCRETKNPEKAWTPCCGLSPSLHINTWLMLVVSNGASQTWITVISWMIDPLLLPPLLSVETKITVRCDAVYGRLPSHNRRNYLFWEPPVFGLHLFTLHGWRATNCNSFTLIFEMQNKWSFFFIACFYFLFRNIWVV